MHFRTNFHHAFINSERRYEAKGPPGTNCTNLPDSVQLVFHGPALLKNKLTITIYVKCIKRYKIGIKKDFLTLWQILMKYYMVTLQEADVNQRNPVFKIPPLYIEGEKNFALRLGELIRL